MCWWINWVFVYRSKECRRVPRQAAILPFQEVLYVLILVHVLGISSFFWLWHPILAQRLRFIIECNGTKKDNISVFRWLPLFEKNG